MRACGSRVHRPSNWRNASMLRRCLPAVVLVFLVSLVSLGSSGVARADGPLQFNTTKLPGAGGSSEPRMTVAPDGTWYTDTTGPGNEDIGWPEYVYRSRDQGLTWQKTPADPPQLKASIDVDTIAMPTGRI